VGSGERCEGIGFGCAPERDLDTLLVVAVYAAAQPPPWASPGGADAAAVASAARWASAARSR